MDELTLVARLREDVPGIDLAGPERRLADAILAAGPRPRSRRRVIVAGTIAATAAVAAAAVVLAVRGQPAGPAQAHAAAPVPNITAAQLVAYAARAAAAAPAFRPKPGDWVYTKTLSATSSAGEGGILFGPPDGKAVRQNWVRVDGRQQASFQHGKLVYSGLLRSGAGRALPGGWPNVSYPYLDSLPSSPVKLKAVIEAGLKAQNYVVGSGNTGVFNAIQALMENVVLPIKLRASLYNVLSRDPAVHFDRRVSDFAGQAGVAFYTRQDGYLKVEIVINPRTYAYMGDREVAYRAHDLPAAVSNGVPSGPYTHIKKGQVTGETAVLSSGIVAHAGQLP
ncbi:MAG TPA: CU044_5270 family protein [Streptosporangiaceae bacterium]|jgi:hypothetical protein